MSDEREVLTIGHSTQTVEQFIDILRQHRVTAVADVRSVPYSRFQPQFNRKALEGVSAEDQDHLRATLRAVLANITGSDDRAEAIVDMRRSQG